MKSDWRTCSRTTPLGSTPGADAFDGGAAGCASDGGMIDGLAVAAAAGGEAASHDRALGHRVDLAVGATQGGEEEDAALQIAGVADSGRGDIDAEAGLGEWAAALR